jgi:hypothetical protein
VEGLVELARLLGVPPARLEAAIGGPWSDGDTGSTAWGEFTIFTGRDNPRTPGRPLIAICVDHAEGTVEVGHAVGVPLPNGRMQWALGEPRTTVPVGEDDLVDWATRDGRTPASMSPEGLRDVMLEALAAGIGRVADVAMMRGTRW